MFAAREMRTKALRVCGWSFHMREDGRSKHGPFGSSSDFGSRSPIPVAPISAFSRSDGRLFQVLQIVAIRLTRGFERLDDN